jgi:hypothetical protein
MSGIKTFGRKTILNFGIQLIINILTLIVGRIL